MTETLQLSAAPLFYLTPNHAEWVKAAAEADLTHISLRTTPVGNERAISTDTSSLEFKEIQQLLKSLSLAVLDVEVFSLNENTSEETWLPVLHAAEKLGAKYLNVVGDLDDRPQLIDLVGRLTSDAKNHGVMPLLEPIAYRPLDSFEDSVKIARDTGCQVELDGLHFVRTRARVETVLDNIDLFTVVQLCDADSNVPHFDEKAREALGADTVTPDEIVESRYFRLRAGEGVFPWKEILPHLPAGSTYYSLENVDALQAKHLTVAEYMKQEAVAARKLILGIID